MAINDLEQEIQDLQHENSELEKKIEKLKAVANAASVIFDVTSNAWDKRKMLTCPHGNWPNYPSHAWWCDKCWNELREALEASEEITAAALDEVKST